MPDIFSYDLLRGLTLPGCAVCRALDADDRRWMDSFRREGRRDRDARGRFFDTGGFCRAHALLLHRLASESGSERAVEDLYGGLAARDLGALESIPASLDRRRECTACSFRAGAEERKAHFFAEALHDEQVREAYLRSQGLCFAHLARTSEAALSADDSETARLLLDDWHERLVTLCEQRSWTQLIRLYVGEDLS